MGRHPVRLGSPQPRGSYPPGAGDPLVTVMRAQPGGDERSPDRHGTPCGRHPLPGPAASASQPVRIRPVCAADRPALVEMLSRCTGSTRSLRFLAPLRSFPEPYLTEALSGHPEHFALVAASPAAVVALASCRAVAGGTADLAVLVEDARQRQGIGARLLKRLVEHADRSGLPTLKATLLAEQDRMRTRRSAIRNGPVRTLADLEAITTALAGSAQATGRSQGRDSGQ